MRNSLSISRASLSLIVPVVLCIAALACGTSSPPRQPSPEAEPIPTATQVEPEPTAEPEFKVTLRGDDLSKFRSLPVEFRDALEQEYEETDAATALRYLRDLPDETLPIAEVLGSAPLGWFSVLQPDDQRFLLLEGYPEVYRRTAQARTDFGGFKFIYEHMIEIVFDNRGMRLPPLEEALSADALAKLDSTAPPLSRAFRLTWADAKPRIADVDDRVKQLEASLLAAPVEMPTLEELGLSDASIAQFRALPSDMREWLWKDAAHELVVRGSLGTYSVMRMSTYSYSRNPRRRRPSIVESCRCPSTRMLDQRSRAWEGPPRGPRRSRRGCRRVLVTGRPFTFRRSRMRSPPRHWAG